MAQQTTHTEHHLRPTALGSRAWLGIIIIGLVGQIAWTVENLYLNDASMLPDSPGVNPQGITMAMARRNALYFAGRHGT